MEIELIEAISTLQQNPSFVSKLFVSNSDTYKFHQAYSFWKWSALALILAMLASFTTILQRIKSLVFILHRLLSPSPPFLNDEKNYYQFSDDDDDVSIDDDESADDTDEYSCSDDEDDVDFEDEGFPCKGSSCFSDDDDDDDVSNDIGFSWLEFTAGKNSVVKLWDDYVMGGLNDVGLFNNNNNNNNVATSSTSGPVVVAADTNFLKVWDTRAGRRIPEILAEWKPRLGRIVGLNAAAGSGVTVADLRKSPLVSVTGCDVGGVETWWDADAVILTDKCVNQSRLGCESVSLRRR